MINIMARSHTTVTIRGDEHYTRALNALASAKGIKIGDLVREAVDEKYGDQLELALPFVATIDREIDQSDDSQDSQDN
jgi:hypothetical protein